MEITSLTLEQALSALKSKQISSRELVQTCLDRIRRYNQKLRSFITVRDEAVKEAAEADRRRKQGNEAPLLGIPVGIKDNFLTQGIRTTSASQVLDDYIPQYDSTVVSRLKQAGAIIIGKTNLDAWGHGSSGEHTDYGFTRNPYAYDRVTGGSSSGSAAAVAADFCFMGTGSDTGGSNRQPASYCNVVGLKPTYGRVSRYGVISMASSTDSMGVLTKSVWDAARCLSVMAGFDPLDATSANRPVEPYPELIATKRQFSIGIADEYFTGLDSQIANSVLTTLHRLEKKGHQLVKISLPIVKYAYPIYCLITFPEISSNLARFDGIRYGNGRDKFADEPRRRMMIGVHALSAGYQDRYYKQAAKARTFLIRDFTQAFKQVDIIAGAVFPFPPFKHGDREIDPLKMYLSDVLTVPANLTGSPAISVPTEFVAGLPNGLQLIAPPFGETSLFQLAYQVEQEHQMYRVKPKLRI